jgi:5-keto 4-deoxyuronate isomerase
MDGPVKNSLLQQKLKNNLNSFCLRQIEERHACSPVVMANDALVDLYKPGCLFPGRGTKGVSFRTTDSKTTAPFSLFAPAHLTFSSQFMKKSKATPAVSGSSGTRNERTLNKYFHEKGIGNCRFVIEPASLKGGSVWNTMPTHTTANYSFICGMAGDNQSFGIGAPLPSGSDNKELNN